MFKEIGDLKVYYDVNGSGHPLVLVHGTGTDSQTWEGMVPHLAKGFEVYTYDLRGFGRTIRPPRPPLSHELWMDDLHRFLISLGIKKASLVGWSLGATIALNFGIHHSELVKHLILIGAYSPRLPPGDRSGFVERLRLARSGVAMEEIVQGTFDFTKKAFSPYTTEGNPLAVEKIRQALIRNEPKSYLEALIANRSSPSIGEKLGKIQCPTLIIVGDADGRTPVEHAGDLNSAIPNSYMKIIAKCGHFYPYEQPELSSRVITDFVKAFA